MYNILAKRILSDTVEEMVIKAPYVSKRCEPGQFVMVRVDEAGERIPLTIMDFDRGAETVTIIYQVVGYSTMLLSQLNAGDQLCDFSGPLGKAAKLKAHKRVLGIGGGVGTAPLYPQLKKLSDMGTAVDVIIGARNASLIILEAELKLFANDVHVVTNDGSKGTQGFVTDALKTLVESGEVYDEIIAIGPLPMMKAVVAYTKALGIKTSVSLNPVMIDGTGMCGGCRVRIGEQTRFACVDGPDFDGHLVDFDELMVRQKYYESSEHMCRLLV